MRKSRYHIPKLFWRQAHFEKEGDREGAPPPLGCLRVKRYT